MAKEEVATKPKAMELVARVKEGCVLISPNGAVVVSKADEEGLLFEVKGLAGNDPKTEEQTINFLSGHKETDLEQYEVASNPKELNEIVERRKLQDEPMKGGEAKKKKLAFPELPTEFEPEPDDLEYIKSGIYELGNGYSVTVHRNQHGAEEYSALLNGDLIASKTRAHKVIRKKFPHHTRKDRPGYELTEDGPRFILRKDGSTMYTKIEPKSKKKVKPLAAIPEGFKLVPPEKLKKGWQVFDIKGNAKKGVPEEPVIEEITNIRDSTSNPDFMTLWLVREDGEGAERKKYRSKNKGVLARPKPKQ